MHLLAKRNKSEIRKRPTLSNILLLCKIQERASFANIIKSLSNVNSFSDHGKYDENMQMPEVAGMF